MSLSGDLNEILESNEIGDNLHHIGNGLMIIGLMMDAVERNILDKDKLLASIKSMRENYDRVNSNYHHLLKKILGDI